MTKENECSTPRQLIWGQCTGVVNKSSNIALWNPDYYNFFDNLQNSADVPYDISHYTNIHRFLFLFPFCDCIVVSDN